MSRWLWHTYEGWFMWDFIADAFYNLDYASLKARLPLAL